MKKLDHLFRTDFLKVCIWSSFHKCGKTVTTNFKGLHKKCRFSNAAHPFERHFFVTSQSSCLKFCLVKSASGIWLTMNKNVCCLGVFFSHLKSLSIWFPSFVISWSPWEQPWPSSLPLHWQILSNSTSPFCAVERVPPTANRATLQKLVRKLSLPTSLSWRLRGHLSRAESGWSCKILQDKGYWITFLKLSSFSPFTAFRQDHHVQLENGELLHLPLCTKCQEEVASVLCPSPTDGVSFRR